MPDWSKSMTQTFEYCEVDPNTWQDVRMLDNVLSSSVNRDLNAETIATASIDSTESFEEMYVRIYLKTLQNGSIESTSLGTFLVQTPHDSFNGKVKGYSYDAYSPLLELKDSQPDVGYYIPKDESVVSTCSRLLQENLRTPVVPGTSGDVMYEAFVAESNETWLSYLNAALKVAKHRLMLDDLSRVIIAPDIDTASMQPVWEYTDDNSSILYPDFDRERDLYGIPNVMQVVYTAPNSTPVISEIVNSDPNSPVSTISRGRRVVKRETNPSINGQPSQQELDEYAKQLLKELSTLEYKVTYTHGYCPVNVGDCVLLNYARAGLVNIKAKVTQQSITCSPGCKVEETAIYTMRMWDG